MLPVFNHGLTPLIEKQERNISGNSGQTDVDGNRSPPAIQQSGESGGEKKLSNATLRKKRRGNPKAALPPAYKPDAEAAGGSTVKGEIGTSDSSASEGSQSSIWTISFSCTNFLPLAMLPTTQTHNRNMKSPIFIKRFGYFKPDKHKKRKECCLVGVFVAVIILLVPFEPTAYNEGCTEEYGVKHEGNDIHEHNAGSLVVGPFLQKYAENCFLGNVRQKFYKTPLVDGKLPKAFASRATAILMALAKALKTASILWCSFWPSTLMLRLQSAASEKDLKK